MYEYFCPLLFVHSEKVKYIIRFLVDFKSGKTHCNIVKSEAAARDAARKAS